MAVNERRKYVYSAADEREWLFDLETDPRETHDFAGNSAYADDLAELSGALTARYRGDGYTSPLDGTSWRRFGKQSLPDNPDDGVLVQHPKGVEKLLAELGPYAPSFLPPTWWMGKPNCTRKS